MRSSASTRPCQLDELPRGSSRDHRRERAHPLAVERRLQQPPLAEVLLAVEQQNRVRAGERPQELPALAGWRDRRVEREHLAHRVGAGEQHHRLLGPVGADRGWIPEALVNALAGTPPGRVIQANVCQAAGARGPGGSSIPRSLRPPGVSGER